MPLWFPLIHGRLFEFNPGGSSIVFVSRRDGNPWNLPLTAPGDLPTSVAFC